MMYLYNSIGSDRYISVKHELYTGAKNGSCSDRPVIDDIHNALMNYIHERPCIWAPLLSSVSDLVMLVAAL